VLQCVAVGHVVSCSVLQAHETRKRRVLDATEEETDGKKNMKYSKENKWS